MRVLTLIIGDARGRGLTAVSDAALLLGAFGEAVLHTDGVPATPGASAVRWPNAPRLGAREPLGTGSQP
ncbi:hypothetical protein ACWDAO_08565 [Streptomyces sp. NPDC001212]|uniref:hypothetical protein n=1 Tax=Streptomyces sp. CoT10 TaxID=2875762 RepID=UPI001CD372A0|nr:hypothetical protein [Streptomyces sp. CoT10]